MNNDEMTVLLTGYAPAPKGTVMQEKQRLFGVILEVDLRTNRVVDADVPGVTDLSRDFFKRIALGYDLSQGVEGLCAKVRARYWATSTESLVACLRLINQRYEEGMKKLGQDKPARPREDVGSSEFRPLERSVTRQVRNMARHA